MGFMILLCLVELFDGLYYVIHMTDLSKSCTSEIV